MSWEDDLTDSQKEKIAVLKKDAERQGRIIGIRGGLILVGSCLTTALLNEFMVHSDLFVIFTFGLNLFMSIKFMFIESKEYELILNKKVQEILENN